MLEMKDNAIAKVATSAVQNHGKNVKQMCLADTQTVLLEQVGYLISRNRIFPFSSLLRSISQPNCEIACSNAKKGVKPAGLYKTLG